MQTSSETITHDSRLRTLAEHLSQCTHAAHAGPSRAGPGYQQQSRTCCVKRQSLPRHAICGPVLCSYLVAPAVHAAVELVKDAVVLVQVAQLRARTAPRVSSRRWGGGGMSGVEQACGMPGRSMHGSSHASAQLVGGFPPSVDTHCIQLVAHAACSETECQPQTCKAGRAPAAAAAHAQASRTAARAPCAHPCAPPQILDDIQH